jgi:hypothetical protein
MGLLEHEEVTVSKPVVVPVPRWPVAAQLVLVVLWCGLGGAWLSEGHSVLGGLFLVLAALNLLLQILMLARRGHQLLPEGVRPYGWLWRIIPWRDIDAVDSDSTRTRNWGQVSLYRAGRRPKRLRGTAAADRAVVERALLAARAQGAETR